jgi:hypothetical protein
MKNLQVNFLILLFITLFITIKNEWWRGSFLALAISFKVFPILLLLFLLIEKRWSLLLKTCLTGVFLLLFPIISYQFSIGELLGEIRHYLTFMASNQHIFPADPSYIHPSIDSFLVRIFMVFPDTRPAVTNLFSLAPKTVWIIIFSIKILLLLPIIFFHIRLKKITKEHRFYLLTSLYFTYSLFINPLAWKHAYVGLTPLLLYVLTLNVKSFKMLIGAVVVLLVFTSHGIIGSYQQIVAMFSPVVWGTILMMAIALYFSEVRTIP